jgi:hypothetical protein
MGKINQTKTRTIYYKLKEARNQARNYFYARKATHSARPTVEYLNSSAEKELCITIAFNTPWTIDLLIDSWGHYCGETRLLVADNSNNPEASKKIRRTCKTKNIAYIKLPKNPVNHPSRSHGLALNWTWRNVVAKLNHLERVGFIDHDCYPIKPCRPNHMSDAFAFGVPKSSWIENSRAMNIWAGFVFFASRSGQRLDSFKFNFLPDALHGLDTGGKNWASVYKHLTASDIAETKYRTISAQEFFKTNSIDSRWSLQLIEETFIHISGVSHKREFESFGRIDIYRLLQERISPCRI